MMQKENAKKYQEMEEENMKLLLEGFFVSQDRGKSVIEAKPVPVGFGQQDPGIEKLQFRVKQVPASIFGNKVKSSSLFE